MQVMGNNRTPVIKSEPDHPLVYQSWTLSPNSTSMSNDHQLVPNARPRRRTPTSPSDIKDGRILPEQDKVKKERPSNSSNTSGKGSLPAILHCISAEEITYTPTTHRISKAKKGKKVHKCTFPGCPKIFTRAEHRRRHEANHNAHPAYQCQIEGCKKPFQRADLLARHLERQHHMPWEIASSHSDCLRGSVSDISSPLGSNARMPPSSYESAHSALAQGTGSVTVGSLAEKHGPSPDYRTQSVPPSLNDRLPSQLIGTAPRGLPREVLYGLSPSGDSLYSSSDSCYSPPSDYYPAPRALAPRFGFGPEIVQRPRSALGSNYPSIATSPMSVGPPTPVSGSLWNGGFDAVVQSFIPETHCSTPRHYATTTSPPWSGQLSIGYHEMALPSQPEWH